VTALDRAVEAWDLFRRSCVRQGPDGLTMLEGPEARRAPVWPYSQALAAAVDMALLTGDRSEADRWVAGLAPYARGDGYTPMPGQRRRYYDDNAWIGLAMTQLHLQTGDAGALEHARRVFRFVAQGQDDDGGVRWVEGRRSRNTCSTAPAAQLALRLHLIATRATTMGFASGALAWLDRALRLPGGMYADHVDRHGVDETLWTYNQGSAAGAHALLSRATDTDTPLGDATRTARASLRHFDGERTWRHPPVFNAVWLRNLLALDAISAVPGLHDALDHYLDRVWRTARDPATGLFTDGGIGSYDGTPAIDQAGLVQLFALRAWPPDRLQDVC
jgi:hypothetical protein